MFRVRFPILQHPVVNANVNHVQMAQNYVRRLMYVLKNLFGATGFKIALTMKLTA
jgi:hypothetical protein